MPPATVLRHFLAIYPAPLSLEELVRELTFASGDYDDSEEIARAVRELLAAGLLRRHGELLLPTRTAVRYPG